MGLAQMSPAQEEWFIMQRNEISNLSTIGLHRHVLGHFQTVKVAFWIFSSRVRFLGIRVNR